MRFIRSLYIPSLDADHTESGSVIMRDGSTAAIRTTEPADAVPLQQFVNRLSLESRRLFGKLAASRRRRELVRFFQSSFAAHVIVTRHGRESSVFLPRAPTGRRTNRQQRWPWPWRMCSREGLRHTASRTAGTVGHPLRLYSPLGRHPC